MLRSRAPRARLSLCAAPPGSGSASVSRAFPAINYSERNLAGNPVLRRRSPRRGGAQPIPRRGSSRADYLNEQLQVHIGRSERLDTPIFGSASVVQVDGLAKD